MRTAVLGKKPDFTVKAGRARIPAPTASIHGHRIRRVVEDRQGSHVPLAVVDAPVVPAMRAVALHCHPRDTSEHRTTTMNKTSTWPDCYPGSGTGTVGLHTHHCQRRHAGLAAALFDEQLLVVLGHARHTLDPRRIRARASPPESDD